ncbi:MAG: hypothetical protein U0835_12170 [Isosphaeraceae bacterium]
MLLPTAGERLLDVLVEHPRELAASTTRRSRISFTYAGSFTVQLKSP